MKRPWTRGEKCLVLAPLLLGAVAGAVALGPRVARQSWGYPTELHAPNGDRIASISLSADGSLLMASGQSSKPTDAANLVHLWDAQTLQSLPPPFSGAPSGDIGYELRGLSMAPNGKTLLWATHEGYTAYDFKARRKMWSLKARGTAFSVSPDSKWVALSSGQRTQTTLLRSVRIVQVQTGKAVANWERTPHFLSDVLKFSPDGRYFASNGPQGPKPTFGAESDAWDTHIELRRVADWKVERRLPVPDATQLAFSPDGKHLTAIGGLQIDFEGEDSSGNHIRCFNLATGQIEWEIDSRSPNADPRLRVADDICYSPDGKQLAVNAAGCDVLLLDAHSGTVLRTLYDSPYKRLPGRLSQGLTFSPDGKRLFGWGNDAILVWDLE